MIMRFFLNDWILNYLEKSHMEVTAEDEILFYAALIIYALFLSCMSGLMYWCGIQIKEYNKKHRGDKK